MADGTATTDNPLATAGMILGIVGAAFIWVPFLNVVLGALAIVFGVLGMRRKPKRAQAIAGFLLGIITLAVINAVI